MATSTQSGQTRGRAQGAMEEGSEGSDEMARKQKPATIIRAPHDRENPYKAVRRATFEDKRLSWEARGILGYLLVKPDTWEISISDLWRAGDVGRDKIYRILAHLEKYGYLERVEVREKGKFVGVRYLLHEEPLPEKQDTVEPEPFPENQDTDEAAPLPENQEPVDAEPLPENQEMATRVEPFPEKPYTVFQEHNNKERESNEESLTKEEKGIVGAAPTPPLDSGWKEYLDALCWVCHGHQETSALTEAQLGALSSEAKKIRDGGYSKEELREWWMKIWRNDWRWDKGRQRPRPDEVRSSIPVVRAVEKRSYNPDDYQDNGPRKRYSMEGM